MKKTTLPYTATPSGLTWFCPLRGQQIQAVVCGKVQTSCRGKCSRAGEKRGVCPHLDSDRATHAWAEYQAGTTPAPPVELGQQQLFQLQT